MATGNHATYTFARILSQPRELAHFYGQEEQLLTAIHGLKKNLTDARKTKNDYEVEFFSRRLEECQRELEKFRRGLPRPLARTNGNLDPPSAQNAEASASLEASPISSQQMALLVLEHAANRPTATNGSDNVCNTDLLDVTGKGTVPPNDQDRKGRRKHRTKQHRPTWCKNQGCVYGSEGRCIACGFKKCNLCNADPYMNVHLCKVTNPHRVIPSHSSYERELPL